MINLKGIKSVDIVYENCEAFSVPIEHVKWLHIIGIKYNLYLYGLNNEVYKTLEKINLIIKKGADNSKYLCLEVNRKPFERTLAYNDIVFIYFKYEDGTGEKINVYWQGDDDYDNPAQKSYIDKDGNLVIEIGKEDG